MKVVSDGKSLEIPSCAAQDIYSTEEQVVGRWIDGKPIYRKIVTGEIGGYGDGWTSIGSISNFDTLISICGVFSYLNQGGDRFMATPDCWRGLSVSISGSVDAYNNNPGSAHGPIRAIVEYTKTTDQATVELPAMLTVSKPMYNAAPASAPAAELKADAFDEEV